MISIRIGAVIAIIVGIFWAGAGSIIGGGLLAAGIVTFIVNRLFED